MTRAYPEKPQTVYFFGTCLIDMAYPDAGVAAIRLLQQQGVEVVFPPDQSCCGQPAYNSGFPDEARAVARQQLKCFDKDYPIVVPSGSCAGMMRCHYPRLFEGRPEQSAARRFSQRVFEWSEFMVRVLDARLHDQGPPIQVTWHSSCHAAREMGVIGYSKSLIRQLAKVELIELAREWECCGFGGTFSVKQPALSGAMVADKIAEIQDTGTQRVLSGDCGCLMNITGAMDKAGIPIQGQHIAEFLWERTNG